MDHPAYPAIDESLYATARAITEAECVLDEIFGRLTGEGTDAAHGLAAGDGGSILMTAERNSSRAHRLVDRLRGLRNLISEPKVQPMMKAAAATQAYANNLNASSGY